MFYLDKSDSPSMLLSSQYIVMILTSLPKDVCLLALLRCGSVPPAGSGDVSAKVAAVKWLHKRIGPRFRLVTEHLYLSWQGGVEVSAFLFLHNDGEQKTSQGGLTSHPQLRKIFCVFYGVKNQSHL